MIFKNPSFCGALEGLDIPLISLASPARASQIMRDTTRRTLPDLADAA